MSLGASDLGDIIMRSVADALLSLRSKYSVLLSNAIQERMCAGQRQALAVVIDMVLQPSLDGHDLYNSPALQVAGG